MEERKTRSTDSLVFAVNGERFELPTVDPSTTVLEFLRTQTRFKGVKLGCGEGGCGACVVLLSKYDPVLKQVEDFVVNSCLTLLCSVNGCSINTTEGLGNSKDGFHPIHQRFAGFHASQCGFCTPGMCVSLFSALVNAEKTHRPEPPPGFSKLTVSEAEKAIAGNLCRCTGYRPIADVCKSFAANVDIEDLGFNSFWKKGESKEVKISRLPFYDPKQQICTYPEFLKTEQNYVTLLDPSRYSWYTPVTIEMLHSLLELSEFEKHLRIKLVAGNTGTGYYKELEHYDKYIDLRHVPELSIIKRSHTGIEIGSTVTISKAILALRKESNCVFEKLADHMEKIASVAIRDTATVGGNLVMAQRNSFPSDLATILLAAGSTLTIVTGLKNEKFTMEEFLKIPALDSRSVLLNIQIPCWQSINDGFSAEMHSKLLFETYRAASRPLGNALAYLNSSFLAVVSPCKTGIVVKKIQLAFGAYGTKHAIRARKVEEYLAEKIISVSVLYESLKLIKETVLPEDGTSDPAYRTSLAVGFLFQFLFPLVDVGNMVSDGQLDGYAVNFPERPSKMKYDHNNFGHVEDPVLLSSGKQEVELSSEYHPVGEPIIKSGSALQASGEAVYVDDIPSPTNCLYGAFIYSTKPLARIKSIKFKSRDIPVGVTDIISYKNIPNGGENVGSKSIFGCESLFADDITDCAGQRIAFVVADTQKSADIAANMAVVEYDSEILEPPILTVEEAVERSSFFPTVLFPEQVGDFSKGLAEADHKILSAKIELGSQYYFYMETQTALAIPDEDDCMVVYSSTQCPENAHIVLARCLGIPEHNIRVITRRVGGGFGGKAIRSIPAAAACALAAHKLRRPVRIYLNRKTDMIMAGGRHPMKITYTVGFKSNGKITALHLDILINAGMSADISPIMPHNVMNPLKKYDWGALSFDIKVCKTNHTSKSAMRAPGEVQGSFIAEAVMENVASVLLMEVDSIRSINLHTFNSLNIFYKGSAGNLVDYTLPSIWNKLAQSSSFFQRKEMIKQFNQSSTWLKKGISRVPIIHEVMQRATPGKVSILGDGSVAVEVGGIEIGQGLWTKVKQMTAFALSLIQCDGAESLLDKVRVIQSDTLSLIQGGFTSGSTTSESSCEAVRLCCNILVERLLPLKKKLMKQMDAVKWNYLIQQANLESVSLSASSYFVPEMTAGQYLNYGAAVSEVEINILTGETRILQADIIYDCGQSLNPAVDLGQIEGAFIQGIGFFMFEEYLANSDGLVVADGTWTYKIPTIDTIPKQFNVHVVNSGHHKNRILSSKASGEPPLLLAVSVYCAARLAIIEARKQLLSWGGRLENPDSTFQMKVPATLPVVKEVCGLDSVERYLESLLLR